MCPVLPSNPEYCVALISYSLTLQDIKPMQRFHHLRPGAGRGGRAGTTTKEELEVALNGLHESVRW